MRAQKRKKCTYPRPFNRAPDGLRATQTERSVHYKENWKRKNLQEISASKRHFLHYLIGICAPFYKLYKHVY